MDGVRGGGGGCGGVGWLPIHNSILRRLLALYLACAVSRCSASWHGLPQRGVLVHVMLVKAAVEVGIVVVLLRLIHTPIHTVHLFTVVRVFGQGASGRPDAETHSSVGGQMGEPIRVLVKHDSLPFLVATGRRKLLVVVRVVMVVVLSLLLILLRLLPPLLFCQPVVVLYSVTPSVLVRIVVITLPRLLTFSASHHLLLLLLGQALIELLYAVREPLSACHLRCARLLRCGQVEKFLLVTCGKRLGRERGKTEKRDNVPYDCTCGMDRFMVPEVLVPGVLIDSIPMSLLNFPASSELTTMPCPCITTIYKPLWLDGLHDDDDGYGGWVSRINMT